MTVTVIGPRNRPRLNIIDTTSRNKDPRWRELSPFHLGPVDCYEVSGANGARVMLRARNVENAWQYSKVYPGHVIGDVMLSTWFEWRNAGFAKDRADRYPMGKGAVPSFSYWNGERLGYVEARRRIYIPLYSKAVRATHAFAELERIYQAEGHLTLWDFDGYLHRELGMSYEDVIGCTTKKMGHAFVLAMMLERAGPFTERT